MLGRQAKILSTQALRRMLAATRKSSFPERDRVMILLSVRAGLRACEIAGLTWDMALDPKGCVSNTLDVRTRIAKHRSGRRVPIHLELAEALRKLWRREQRELLHRGRRNGGGEEDIEPGPGGPIIRSARGGAMQPNSVVNWFVSFYAELGLEGCSSHSGRRTFITHAARRAHHAGASLRDVQLLAGHRSIETTQGYIDGDSAAQRKLVSLM